MRRHHMITSTLPSATCSDSSSSRRRRSICCSRNSNCFGAKSSYCSRNSNCCGTQKHCATNIISPLQGILLTGSCRISSRTVTTGSQHTSIPPPQTRAFTEHTLHTRLSPTEHLPTFRDTSSLSKIAATCPSCLSPACCQPIRGARPTCCRRWYRWGRLHTPRPVEASSGRTWRSHWLRTRC